MANVRLCGRCLVPGALLCVFPGAANNDSSSPLATSSSASSNVRWTLEISLDGLPLLAPVPFAGAVAGGGELLLVARCMMALDDSLIAAAEAATSSGSPDAIACLS